MSTGTSAGRRVVVLGGTSEIALAIVRDLLRRGPREVVLIGRDPPRLQAAAEELVGAGATHASTLELDANDSEAHEPVLAEAFQRLGGADLVLLAVGRLGQRGGIPGDVPDALEVMRTSFVAAGSLLLCAAHRLRQQRGGTLVVLSSVAGERVRASNVVYGASKAGLDALAQGLADALHADGVRVVIVRPGFVRTRMTAGLRPPPLATDPARVARGVVDALDGRAAVVWAPPSLRWLMLALRLMPRPVFRRLPI